MLNWLFSRSLESALKDCKKVKIQGVRFRIRKISPLDYMSGANVLKQTYDIYKTKTEEGQVPDDATLKKVKEHYAHTLAAGIVEPKISLKDEEGAINAYKFLENWELALAVYTEIMEYSYGKKKVRRLIWQKPS